MRHPELIGDEERVARLDDLAIRGFALRALRRYPHHILVHREHPITGEQIPVHLNRYSAPEDCALAGAFLVGLTDLRAEYGEENVATAWATPATAAEQNVSYTTDLSAVLVRQPT